MTLLEAPPSIAEFVDRAVSPHIDGEQIASASQGTFETIDPATGEMICLVGRCGQAEVDRAVASARRALDDDSWGRWTPAQRAQLLFAIGDAVATHRHELAYLETLDCGMLHRHAVDAVDRAVEHFRYFAGWATKIYGDTIPVSNPGWFNFTKPIPVGVCAGIIAWNTPLDNATWKLGAPLAAGCPVILKPAEQTPLTALMLGQLIRDAGAPHGVVNVLTGYGDVGAMLARHDGVDKVAFTGSTEVGREITRASAGNLKHVALELGGKSPAIILTDADLEAAADGIFTGMFHNAGQICCASSLVLTPEALGRATVDALSARAMSLRLGNGFAPATEMGPLISERQVDRSLRYIDAGHADGATMVVGGKRAEGELSNGCFVEPTVFDNVTPSMRIARDEIFGPVLSVATYGAVDELRALANASPYGLSASVWTNDLSRALWTVDQIDAGIVWVNGHTVLDLASPFGGTKQSGHGRELGRDAVESYVQHKSVWLRYAEPVTT